MSIRRLEATLAFALAVAFTAADRVAPAAPSTRPAAAVAFDLQGFIDAALKSGEKTIVIPPGRYAVAPRNAQHLVLHDLKDVTIVAEGVEMVCTQTTRALTIDRCANVTLRGLTIDYDPLPFTQGRITAVAPDRSWLEFELIDGYPDQKLETRIEIYDAKTALLKTETDYRWHPFESLGGRHYRVARDGPKYCFDPAAAHEDVGDVLVTNNAAAPGGSQPHAIVSTDCRALTLEDVSVYASNCFGYLEYDCDRTTYRRCRLDRRAPGDDPVARGVPRMRSTDADAFHSIDSIRGPAILNCVAKFQGDDCVNIHGSYQMVMSCDGATLRVLSMKTPKVEPGDPMELLTYDGRRLPDVRVKSIAPAGKVTADERAWLLAQQMNESIKRTGLNDAYTITLERPADLARGSVCCSTRRTGNGFRVEGCDFGFNRSRGILMKASDGTITDNRITGTWGAAIQVQPEVWWLESGSSNHLKIERNVITDCRTVGIEVTAVGGNRAVAPSGAHNDVAIVGNTIVGGGLPNVWVTSTDGLRIAGTIVRRPTTAPSVGGSLLRSLGLDPSKRTPVMVANCDGASVSNE